MANRSMIILAVVAFLTLGVNTFATDIYQTREGFSSIDYTDPNNSDAPKPGAYLAWINQNWFTQGMGTKVDQGINGNAGVLAEVGIDSLSFNTNIAAWMASTDKTLQYSIAAQWHGYTYDAGTGDMTTTTTPLPYRWADDMTLSLNAQQEEVISATAASFGSNIGIYEDPDGIRAYNNTDWATLPTDTRIVNQVAWNHHVLTQPNPYDESTWTWDTQPIYASAINTYYTFDRTEYSNNGSPDNVGKFTVANTGNSATISNPTGSDYKTTVSRQNVNGMIMPADIIVKMAYNGVEGSINPNDMGGGQPLDPIVTKVFVSATRLAECLLYPTIANRPFETLGYTWDNNTGQVMNGGSATVYGNNALQNFVRYVFDIKGLVVQDVDNDGVFDNGQDYILFTLADTDTYGAKSMNFANPYLDGVASRFNGKFFDGKTVFLYDGTNVTTYIDPTSGTFYGVHSSTVAGSTVFTGAIGDFQIDGLDLGAGYVYVPQTHDLTNPWAVPEIPEPSTMVAIGAALALGAGLLRRRVR